MLLTEDLKFLLKDCNDKLKEKYENQSNLARKDLRRLISKVAKFINLNRMEKVEIDKLMQGRPIIGVDGSVNKQGKVYPHYIELLQALAKSTDRSQDGIVKQRIFSPLIEDDMDMIKKKFSIANNQEDENDKIYPQEIAGKIRSSLLACLEVLVARDSILKYNPSLIMMDGSLIRYKIQAEEEWEELVELALERDVLIIGVIEEIGTRDISTLLGDDLPNKMTEMYDRELMFGLLGLGEMMLFGDSKDQLKKAFVRSSRDPGVVGIDILKEQSGAITDVASLVYSLTPEAGRGIPIWLDIVDEEVRISNKMMEMVIDNYLDPTLKQRLFHSKRADRVY
ncbi:NurA domain-containing protein [Orenia metallireducens]|uniref:NurA domain-containing protein n=1 Tax=Orenia metallireducens TaxID=1413210 RepID=A0A1C0A6M8_9FIRM|nr:DNA double-strand break repair nuclease NurA [Orenia metallireducens]OCL25787.1 NurA domain-containing protein [Orenia metallireducens]